jgi:hypothetical protein
MHSDFIAVYICKCWSGVSLIFRRLKSWRCLQQCAMHGASRQGSVLLRWLYDACICALLRHGRRQPGTSSMPFLFSSFFRGAGFPMAPFSSKALCSVPCTSTLLHIRYCSVLHAWPADDRALSCDVKSHQLLAPRRDYITWRKRLIDQGSPLDRVRVRAFRRELHLETLSATMCSRHQRTKISNFYPYCIPPIQCHQVLSIQFTFPDVCT